EMMSPVSSGAYHSPIDVTGLSQTFAGHVRVSLVDTAGTVLAERTTVGGSDEGAAFFHTFLRFTVGAPVSAELRVVDLDLGDGTVMAEVVVPLTLLPGQRVVDVQTPAVAGTVCG